MSSGGRPGAARPPRLRVVVLLLSVLWCLVVTVLYALRPAAAEAITFAPPWLWSLPGLLLAVLGFSRPTRRASLEAVALWAAYLLVTTESLATQLPVRHWPAVEWQARRASGTAVRVVSLNCAGGSAEAAGEVAVYAPDIILLQESPGARDVETVARRVFGAEGAAVVGMDTAIAARGPLEAAALTPSERRYFVQARVALPGGGVVEVVSLRLMPGAARVDLWSPECWRQQRESHRSRAEELAAVAQRLGTLPDGVPVIVGGDFNAPAGDAVFRLLPRGLTEAFRTAGVGWGETMMNDLPVLRIDQVWVSEAFRPAAVVARQTRNSDHRMVVCDLLVRGGGGQR